MFYEINEELAAIKPEQIDENKLTIGCITPEELRVYGKQFGFDDETIEASQRANPTFRTGVDVHAKYTFTELRVVNRDAHEDFVSIFIKKNLLLMVDIIDEDKSTSNSFLKILRRYPAEKMNEERMVFCLIDSLLADGNRVAEAIQDRLTEMEESIVKDQVEKRFNIDLLDMKKKILKYYNFYGQILDITETLEENDNEIFDEERLIYIANLTNKITRLGEDMKSLSSTADHIQDAYATYLDQRMNNTMKVFTTLTSIFFPLTIIVGWYGMNFQHMPELTWKYGYVYVSILSILVVLFLVILGKKKKWF